MYIFRRGATVPFKQTYYDSTGGTVEPSSVRCWVSYLSTALENDGMGVLDMGRKTTNFALTYNSTTATFEGSWSSTDAYPGTVYYHIKPADTTLDVVDGQFELRGNPANLIST